jgi:hypothetical protein
MTKPKPYGEPKTNYTIDTLTLFCSKNLIILNNNYNNIKVTRDTKISGKCLSSNCNNDFNKVFRQLISTNGYCNTCTKNNKIKKIKHLQPIIRQSYINTCLEKYNVENTFQNETFKQKIIETNLKNNGVKFPQQSKIIRDKRINTYLKNYGYENPQQAPEIAEKSAKNSYRKKIYILPSGKELICQGYEPFALEKLIKEENITEEDIVTGCKNVPQIWYDDEECKKHRHYVDIFIPSQNRCIEVKSTWTSEKNKDNIYLKQNAAKEFGYQYEIWIFNAKKELLEVKT